MCSDSAQSYYSTITVVFQISCHRCVQQAAAQLMWHRHCSVQLLITMLPHTVTRAGDVDTGTFIDSLLHDYNYHQHLAERLLALKVIVFWFENIMVIFLYPVFFSFLLLSQLRLSSYKSPLKLNLAFRSTILFPQESIKYRLLLVYA